jgi:hypothetical protein
MAAPGLGMAASITGMAAPELHDSALNWNIYFSIDLLETIKTSKTVLLGISRYPIGSLSVKPPMRWLSKATDEIPCASKGIPEAGEGGATEQLSTFEDINPK